MTTPGTPPRRIAEHQGRLSDDASETRPSPALVAGDPLTEPAGWVVAGRYRLRRLLGRGGMGVVWLAAILTAVVTDPPAPLLRAGPLGAVIEGLLAKDPARRLGPDQARAALQAIRRGESPGRIQVRPRARRPRSQGAGDTRPPGRIRPASRLVGPRLGTGLSPPPPVTASG